MKIKIDKQFLKIIGIAGICAFATAAIIDILSLLSWGVVFVALTFLFMPIAQGAIKFYEENDCLGLDDFFRELMKDDSNKRDSIME